MARRSSQPEAQTDAAAHLLAENEVAIFCPKTLRISPSSADGDGLWVSDRDTDQQVVAAYAYQMDIEYERALVCSAAAVAGQSVTWRIRMDGPTS